MSTLFYGGDVARPTDLGAALRIVKTLHYSRTPVYDGNGHGLGYCYTQHRIHVRAMYSPPATAYEFEGKAITDNVEVKRSFRAQGAAAGGAIGLPAGGVGGSIAPVTDVAIRHYLMQPRRRLVYCVGDYGQDGGPMPTVNDLRGQAQSSLILWVPFQPPNATVNPSTVSSGDGRVYLTDAANGPVPQFCNVTRIDGGNHFWVEFCVEAYVNEAYLYLYKPPILLSHLWDMEHSVTPEGFTQRTIFGRAVFRADVLDS